MDDLKTNNFKHLYAYTVLSSIFIACYALAPLLALKPLDFGYALAPAGVLTFSLLFPCTDIITEIYGKKLAQMTVIGGLIAMFVITCITQIAISLPAAEFWKDEEAFNTIFGTSWRIFIASFIAYSSQFADIYIYDYIRKKSNGRFLWLRNNVSTLSSQLIGATLFTTIAFYGVFETKHIINLILTSMIVRIAFAFIDTPLVYLGVTLIKRHHKNIKKA